MDLQEVPCLHNQLYFGVLKPYYETPLTVTLSLLFDVFKHQFIKVWEGVGEKESWIIYTLALGAKNCRKKDALNGQSFIICSLIS